MRAVLLPALTLALAISACGSNEEDSDEPARFDVSAYDRSCAAMGGCLMVFAGDPCGCDCAVTAIATSASMSYDADRDVYMARACPNGALVCGPCPPVEAAVCNDGQCAPGP